MSRQRTFIPLNAGPTYLAEGKREDWLRTPLTGNLSEIHGIKKGGVYETKFHEAGIMNTWQLIGEFLKMRGVDSDGKTIDSVEHCERFFIWLGAIGIGGSSKPSITLALAEKINLMIIKTMLKTINFMMIKMMLETINLMIIKTMLDVD
jgi:hypothetical protein